LKQSLILKVALKRSLPRSNGIREYAHGARYRALVIRRNDYRPSSSRGTIFLEGDRCAMLRSVDRNTVATAADDLAASNAERTPTVPRIVLAGEQTPILLALLREATPVPTSCEHANSRYRCVLRSRISYTTLIRGLRGPRLEISRVIVVSNANKIATCLFLCVPISRSARF